MMADDNTVPDYDASVDSLDTLKKKLMLHILLKGWQAGSVIGLCAAVPLQALLSKGSSLPKAARTCGIAPFAGMAVAGERGCRLPGPLTLIHAHGRVCG